MIGYWTIEEMSYPVIGSSRICIKLLLKEDVVKKISVTCLNYFNDLLDIVSVSC